MSKSDRGAIQTSMLVTIVMSVLFVGSLIFGLSMFVGKNDLQKNLDKKVQAQVGTAVKQAETKLQATHDEQDKSLVKNYTGPATFGTVSIDYPKTYSAYVDETSSGTTAVNAYFMPNVVPKEDRSTTYALRMQVVQTSYDSLVKTFDTNLKAGKVTVKPFRADKVNSVLGVRIDGEISTGKQGSLILIPLRDKTIKIWTEGKDYVGDFDKYVVPSINFVP